MSVKRDEPLRSEAGADVRFTLSQRVARKAYRLTLKKKASAAIRAS